MSSFRVLRIRSLGQHRVKKKRKSLVKGHDHDLSIGQGGCKSSHVLTAFMSQKKYTLLALSDKAGAATLPDFLLLVTFRLSLYYAYGYIGCAVLPSPLELRQSANLPLG